MKPEVYNSQIIDEITDSITPEEQRQIEIKMLLTAKLSDAMEAKGWQVKDLAAAVGAAPICVADWISGTYNLTLDILVDLERVLEVKLLILDKN